MKPIKIRVLAQKLQGEQCQGSSFEAHRKPCTLLSFASPYKLDVSVFLRNERGKRFTPEFVECFIIYFEIVVTRDSPHGICK